MTIHGHKPGAKLLPILRPATAALLAQEALLADWVERYGSPLNLIWPDELGKNIAVLREVLDHSGIEYEIFYGAKVNKSPGLMASALRAGIGLDVSSVFELRDARQLGADGGRIVATGPAKSPAFHRELIDCGALVSVDSPEELDDLIQYLPPGRSVQPVLLRLCPRSEIGSRFGMSPEAIRYSLSRIARESRLRFDGLHFHASGYRWETRAEAISQAAGLIDEARQRGFAPRMIDIGGGLPIQYVDDRAYQIHLDRQKDEDYRTGKVPATFYPYGGAPTAAEWLRRLLDVPMADGRSIAAYFAQERLVLGMEPGRALADQVAISVFRILRVKRVESNAHIIFVEGSSFSACETWFASEYLVDPILLPVSTSAEPQSIRAYLAGHSCLNEDVISNRWLTFPIAPRAGDLLIYANTGGYQMDLLENEFHRHPMPNRLCVVRTADGQPNPIPDIIGRH
jgi:diaminopimelate decarboxylase